MNTERELERVATKLHDALSEIRILKGTVTAQDAEIRELIAQRDAAREDLARLDWMIDRSNEGNGWLGDDVWDTAGDLPNYGDFGEGDVHALIRAAIDAARKPTPTEVQE